MTLTNRYNLPQPFVDAVTSDDYDKGESDFTTTELITPVRISAFSQKFFGERVEDVSERVWTLFGQAKHVVLERIARTDPERYIVEKRFYTTLPGGTKVGGRIDLYDSRTKILYDWKDGSVWKLLLGDTKDWEEQGNINVYLLRAWGLQVSALKNVTFLKDWKVRKARIDQKYPQCAVHVVPLPIWSAGQQQAFILERVRQHKEMRENPPVCTEKERWERPAALALMKKGNKRAKRLYDNHQQAYAALDHWKRRAKPGEQFFLEQRPTEPTRCLDYCPVRKFCEFGIEAARKWKEDVSD